MVGLNSHTPSVFWNGKPVPNITSIKVDWEDDEQRVKLRVTSMDMALYHALVSAGVSVRMGEKHE